MLTPKMKRLFLICSWVLVAGVVVVAAIREKPVENKKNTAVSEPLAEGDVGDEEEEELGLLVSPLIKTNEKYSVWLSNGCVHNIAQRNDKLFLELEIRDKRTFRQLDFSFTFFKEDGTFLRTEEVSVEWWLANYRRQVVVQVPQETKQFQFRITKIEVDESSKVEKADVKVLGRNTIEVKEKTPITLLVGNQQCVKQVFRLEKKGKLVVVDRPDLFFSVR